MSQTTHAADAVTLKKISKSITETSSVACGRGRRGNGFRVSARWAAIKSGEHVATIYADNGFWPVMDPKTCKVITLVADKAAALRWLTAHR